MSAVNLHEVAMKAKGEKVVVGEGGVLRSFVHKEKGPMIDALKPRKEFFVQKAKDGRTNYRFRGLGGKFLSFRVYDLGGPNTRKRFESKDIEPLWTFKLGKGKEALIARFETRTETLGKEQASRNASRTEVRLVHWKKLNGKKPALTRWLSKRLFQMSLKREINNILGKELKDYFPPNKRKDREALAGLIHNEIFNFFTEPEKTEKAKFTRESRQAKESLVRVGA